MGLITSTYYYAYLKGELQKFVEEVHSLLTSILKTKIQKVFKFEEWKEALAYYKANSAILLKIN